jgi:uncharacterized protein YraI
MELRAFLEALDSIVDKNPTYRTGGSGKDGTCDCVGMIIGAMQIVDKRAKFPLHSSNYFARKRMSTLAKTQDAEPLPGMAVYKAREDTGELNERYKNPRSQYYNGSLLDYYHVGVVRSTEPMLIYHCTRGGRADGIVADRSLNGWTHIGRLSDIDYAEVVNGMPETRKAVVATVDGNPLKLRPSPSTQKAAIAKIPNGDSVAVYADAEGWAKVSWAGYTGYCMSSFLQYENSGTVVVELEREQAEALLFALQTAMDAVEIG